MTAVNVPAYVAEILPHERPPVYVLDGTTYFRASVVGYCIRQLTFARLGYERIGAPLFLRRAAAEGHMHEAAIVAEMRADGWSDTLPEPGGAQAVVRLQQPTFQVIGHADLIGIPPDSVAGHFPALTLHDPVLVEIKALSDAQFGRFCSGMWDEFPHYADQLTVAMVAADIPWALYLLKNRNTGEIRHFPILKPPSDIETILRRLTLVELLGRKGKLAEPQHEPGSFECMACPYRYACRDENRQYETGIELTAVLNPAEVADLVQTIETHRRAKAMEKQAKEILVPLRVQLEDLLTLTGSKKLTLNGLTWQMVRGGKYLPVHRVKAVMSPEVLAMLEEQKKDHMMVRDKGE